MILSEDKDFISDFEEKVLRGYLDDIKPEDYFAVSISKRIISDVKAQQQCFECGSKYREVRCEVHPKAIGCYRCHLLKEHKIGKKRN